MNLAVKLPDRPSVLLRMALLDLESFTDRPGLSVDMLNWVRWLPDGKHCTACLAGAWLVQRSGLDLKDPAMFSPGGLLDFNKVTRDVRDAMEALDAFRRGDIQNALCALGVRQPDDLSDTEWVGEYHDDPAKFKAAMLEIVKLLETHNL